MLKIRLKRTGRRNRPHYRIVVAESSSRRDGKVLATLGFYNPRTKELGLHLVKLRRYIRNGAQITKRAWQLVTQYTQSCTNS
jgi:small subunit ribosomal protein S16